MLGISQKEKLSHLAKILSNIDSNETLSILDGLDKDLSFSREAMDFLGYELFTFQSIVDNLNPEEIRTLLKELPSHIILGLEQEFIKDRLFQWKHFFSPNHWEKIHSSENNKPLSPEEAKLALLEAISKKVTEGSIFFNSPALLFALPFCRQGKKAPLKSDHVFFQILNPIVAPEEGIKFLVYAPKYIRQHFYLSLQASNALYFNKNKNSLKIELDLNGFYYGEIFPDRKEPAASVWLDISETGRLCRTVLFSANDSSPIHLGLKEKTINQTNKAHFVFTYACESSVKEEMETSRKGKVTVFCSACGTKIGSVLTDITQNEIIFDFLMPEKIKNHNSDLFFYFETAGHHAGIILNPNTITSSYPRIHTKERKISDSLSFEYQKTPDDLTQIFFHVSSSQETDDYLMERISGGTTPTQGKMRITYPRKTSTLESELLLQKILLLSSPKGSFNFGSYTFKNNEPFFYSPENEEKLSVLYVTAYSFSEGGIKPISRMISKPKNEINLYLSKPESLENNEQVEANIFYKVPQNSVLHFSNGSLEKISISGKGKIPVLLKANENYSLGLSTENQFFKKEDFILKPRRIQTVKYEYIKEGTVLTPSDNEEIIVFRSPKDLQREILISQIIKYPWGCGEQTSAKISGYAFLMTDIPKGTSEYLLITHINNGIKYLKGFSNNEGCFTTMHHRTHSVEDTQVIYSNLALALPLRNQLIQKIPALYQLTDSLERFLNQHSRGTITARKGRKDKFVAAPGEISSSFDEDYLFFDGQNLSLTEKKYYFQTLSQMCMIHALNLLFSKKDFMLVKTAEHIKKTPVKRTGISRILEYFGLLNPLFDSVKEDVLEPLKDPMPLLLKNIEISFHSKSYPSTVLSSLFTAFITEIKKDSPFYEYDGLKNEWPEEGTQLLKEELKILSSYTFIKRKSDLKPTAEIKNIPKVIFSRKKLRLGGKITLSLKRISDRQETYTLYLPACLSSVAALGYMTARQTISFSNFDGKMIDITLRAINRGNGPIRLLVEDMYNTKDFYIVDLADITVE